jgi:hypothetical protein
MNKINTTVPADIPPHDHGAAEDAQASGNRGVEMNQLLPFEEVSQDKVVIETPVEVELAAHAAVIRVLGKRVVGDVIEIGRRLTECKATLGHGNWLPWLDREFGWEETTALRFMRVFELQNKSGKLLDLDVPVSSLYLLAAPSTPKEARDAVIDAAAGGKRLTHDEVKDLIARAVEESGRELSQQIDEANRQLSDLRAEHDRRQKEIEQKIRGEYALKYEDKVVLTEAEMGTLVADQMKPLEKQLKDTQQQLESSQRELERIKNRKKEQDGTPAQTLPKIDATQSMRSTRITGSIARLAEDLTITAAEMIDVEVKTAAVTGQKLSDRIEITVERARCISGWLEQFIQAAVEGRQNERS